MSAAGGLTMVLEPVAKLVTRHPRKVLVAWLLVMGLLSLQGIGLQNKLSTQPVYIDGTASQRAHSIIANQFGGEDTLVVMLRGPLRPLERQGANLAHRLDTLPNTLVISPWSGGGAIKGLRPRPGVAALLISVDHRTGEASTAVPDLKRAVRETIAGPVQTSLAGGPAIVDSLRGSVETAADTGEKLAIPVLLIVLLFVCRSLIGAAMPVVVGGAVVAASKGVLDLLHGFVTIDPLAIGVAAMLGLALGVDYSLLIISRYRQETGDAGDVASAVQRTVTTTGRSVIPAGCGLVLAMLVPVLMLPGTVGSVAIAVSTVAVLSMLSAIFVSPALLMLLGSRLDRWSLPPRRDEGVTVMRWSRWVSSRLPFALAILFLLVLCAGWAFTLNVRSGSIQQLPPNDPGRLQQEEIQRSLGPGWLGPLEVVMNGRDEPVTTPARLHALADFQRRVESDPGVEAMAGFTSFARATNQLGGVEKSLASQQKGLDRLSRGVARTHKGATSMTEGFLAAANGADRLGSAVGASQAGSSKLAAGLERSSRGSQRLSGGLERADDGSDKVANAASKASAGASKLARKVAHARERAGETTSSARVLKNALHEGEQALTGVKAPLATTEAQLLAAWQALQQMSSGRTDPQYRAALEAVTAAILELTGAPPGSEEGSEGAVGVGTGVNRAQDQFGLGLYLAGEIGKRGRQSQRSVAVLARSSMRLDQGLRRLRQGSRKVSDGIGRAAGGSEELTPGLQLLTHGAAQLSGGLGQIESGTGRLASGLGGGAHESRLLAGGLGRIHRGVERQQRDGAGSQAGRLRKQSPGLFRSGYFYLASLDGAAPHRRDQAGLLVNLNRGGTAARMLVIPNSDPSTSAAEDTTRRIRGDAERLARETNSEVVVGGWGPGLTDINTTLEDKGPITRLVLSLVTILIILLVTRSLALALIAALLNLLTVSATFGLLALLFDSSLLGGPGYVDSSMIAASVTIVFGLAIDYEIFVFARIREEYLRTGSTAEAIDNGLGRTAHVITGAALIMCAVFIAFSISSLAPIRNLGVGLAIATVIDALIIRFVLLPAAMRALDERSWWLPAWLDTLLPGGREIVPEPLPKAAS